MTRAGLAENVSKALGVTPNKADLVVLAVLEGIKNGLVSDGKVILRGFGRFIIQNKKERIGRNPKTGKDAVITARRRVAFKFSSVLKGTVNC
jgi:integration host factor subunit alpha